MGLATTLKFIADHPLCREDRLNAFGRFVRWQIGSRIAMGPTVVNFVNDTRLVVRPGMTGATGNIYVGLHEFHDMAFVLHFLRPDDRVVDIGANIGSYSILSALTGAQVSAFEPISQTFETLALNIAVNGYGGRIQARQAAIGRETGVIKFTTGLDTMNHVATSAEAGPITEVPVLRLDEAVSDPPVLIKIDVEGFETDVIAGAEQTLAHPDLQVVLMELNGSGARYGYDEAPLHSRMMACGFAPYAYDGLSRRLTALEGVNGAKGNTLYIRDAAHAAERARTAPSFTVIGKPV